MNYHIMIDDKFIESFIKIAEEVSPGKNRYIYTFSFPGKYVKNVHGESALYGSVEFEKIINGISGDDRVYVHWFNEAVQPYINKLPANVPVYLFLWGGDFLEQPGNFQEYNLGALTSRYVKHIQRWSEPVRVWNPRSVLAKLNYYLKSSSRIRRRQEREVKVRKAFLERLNFCCHWNIDDIRRIEEEYAVSIGYRDFFYDLGLQNIKVDEAISFKGDKTIIWLGNSATYTNNHLEAFDLLKKFAAEEFRLVAPLSYGNENYQRHILRKGKQLFGNKFDGMQTFIPLDKYLDLLKEVDAVLMNHHRSQAGANTFSFIYMGKKVFLNRRSSVYDLMLRNGVKVFDIESISKLSFNEFLAPLSIEEKRSNSEIIGSLFSEERRRRLLSEILN